MRPYLWCLVLVACGGGGGAVDVDAHSGGDSGSGSNTHHPDAGAHPDAPPDAGPDGMYSGPTDGNLCSESGWCPVEPAIPATLRGMSGIDSNDVWAVGEAGTLLHYDGTKWTRVAANTHDELNGVKSFDRDDVWAISTTAAYHFDGHAWTKSTIADLQYPYAIAGSSGSNVWIAEYNGIAHHYDGSSWTKTQTPGTNILYTIWSASSNDAWAGGNGNGLYHWNGASWASVTSPYSGADPQYNAFVGLYGTTSNNVWLSNGSQVFHWDGAGWAAAGYLSSSGYVLPLWGRGADDIWSPGGAYKIDHYDGSSWKSLDVNFADNGYIHNGLAGFSASATDVWMTTTYGGLAHGDATTFGWVYPGARIQNRNTIVTTSSSNAWVLGEGPARHWDGTAWSDVTLPATGYLHGAFALSPSNIYAAGDSGSLIHYDGTTWTKIAGIPTQTWTLYAVWASGPSDVYAIGYLGNLSHWDGSTWTSAWSGATTNHVYGLYGFSATDIWGAAQNGTIIHKTAAGWTSTHPGTYDLYSVWGANANDVWVGGQFGHTFHWNGTAWSEVTTPATTDYADLHAIRGTSSTDVWAAGSNGMLYHWDGTAWSRMQSGTSSKINSLAYIGSTLFGAADYGTIVHGP